MNKKGPITFIFSWPETQSDADGNSRAATSSAQQNPGRAPGWGCYAERTFTESGGIKRQSRKLSRSSEACEAGRHTGGSPQRGRLILETGGDRADWLGAIFTGVYIRVTQLVVKARSRKVLSLAAMLATPFGQLSKSLGRELDLHFPRSKRHKKRGIEITMKNRLNC